MPGFQTFLLFLAAALVVAITPGPGVFYIVARTLAGGRAEGLASSVGLGLGGLVHVFAGALGISALFMASAEAFTLLKMAGALYLIWLGLKTRRKRASLNQPNCRPLECAEAFAKGSLSRRNGGSELNLGLEPDLRNSTPNYRSDGS